MLANVNEVVCDSVRSVCKHLNLQTDGLTVVTTTYPLIRLFGAELVWLLVFLTAQLHTYVHIYMHTYMHEYACLFEMLMNTIAVASAAAFVVAGVGVA